MTMQTTPAFEAFAAPGGRGRAACAELAPFGSDLAGALRRALPFLARKRIVVTSTEPRCVSFAELAADATMVHASAFTVERIARAAMTTDGAAHPARAAERPAGGSTARVRGLLLVDEMALARILDGVFGGDGAPVDGPAPLTSAQLALAARVAGAMLRAFGEVLAAKTRLAVEAIASKDIDSGGAVAVDLEIDGGGKIVVALPLSVFGGEEPAQSEVVDRGIAAAMAGVEVDVVAELGKVRLPLSAISNLQVGDVLRLMLPLDERARVCAGGALLFHGRPTAHGNVVGVTLEAKR